MKRFAVILVLLLLVGAVGCGREAALNLDVEACAQALYEAVAFEDALTPVSDEMAAVLYQIDEKDVAAQKVFVSTGATAEEIAVFAAVDKEAAARVKEAVLQRVAEQEKAFRDYLPAELPKLQNPYLKVIDRYVILCISAQNNAAKAAVEKLINAQ